MSIAEASAHSLKALRFIRILVVGFCHLSARPKLTGGIQAGIILKRLLIPLLSFICSPF
jgi:hypothetical protein